MKIKKEDYEKANETVRLFENQCSSCGCQLGDSWEYSANSFDIILRIDCQSTTALFGDMAKEIGFKHPAIAEGSDYQQIILKSDRKLPYKLCPSCNRKLFKLIGDFLISGV